MAQVRGFACDCSYPDSCDSQSAPLPVTRLAEKLKLDSPLSVPKGLHPKDALSRNPTHKDVNDSIYTQLTRNSSKNTAGPVDLESRHVVDVYDAIASHFSATRY